eukprot:1157208-Pelagomonas_calceolata.AAC.4
MRSQNLAEEDRGREPGCKLMEPHEGRRQAQRVPDCKPPVHEGSLASSDSQTRLGLPLVLQIQLSPAVSTIPLLPPKSGRPLSLLALDLLSMHHATSSLPITSESTSQPPLTRVARPLVNVHSCTLPAAQLLLSEPLGLSSAQPLLPSSFFAHSQVCLPQHLHQSALSASCYGLGHAIMDPLHVHVHVPGDQTTSPNHYHVFMGQPMCSLMVPYNDHGLASCSRTW